MAEKALDAGRESQGTADGPGQVLKLPPRLDCDKPGCQPSDPTQVVKADAAQPEDSDSDPDYIAEQVVELPVCEQQLDRLLNATISKVHKGVTHIGVVKCILIGKQSRQRLYEVHWQDGDTAHLSTEAAVAGWQLLSQAHPKPPIPGVQGNASR